MEKGTLAMPLVQYISLFSSEHNVGCTQHSLLRCIAASSWRCTSRDLRHRPQSPHSTTCCAFPVLPSAPRPLHLRIRLRQLLQAATLFRTR